MNGRDVQPNFERLWHDCLQEESRFLGRNGSMKGENVALATKTKKGKKLTPRKKGRKPKGPSEK